MGTDLELLERWRDGDKDAGGELLARHLNMLRVFFIRRLWDSQVEDHIQEVFTRMVEGLERFEGRCSVRTYLIRIAQNRVREVLRDRYRANGPIEVFRESIFEVSGQGFSSMLAGDERAQLLLDAMQHVTMEQQDLLGLYYFHEFKLRELANLYKLPLGTVKSRMEAARIRLLREFVELLGEDVEDWTQEMLERGLERLRDEVLRGRKRKRKRDEGPDSDSESAN